MIKEQPYKAALFFFDAWWLIKTLLKIVEHLFHFCYDYGIRFIK